MSYTAIDFIISAWATKHGLTVYTQHLGEEVRSVDVVSPKGRKYQIWVDPPRGRFVTIHAWDYKKQRRDWDVVIDQLPQSLEDAIHTVKSWMGN